MGQDAAFEEGVELVLDELRQIDASGGLGLLGLESGLIEQETRDGCTTCSTGVTSLGCAASSRRSGIGSASTHWRTGTCGMT